MNSTEQATSAIHKLAGEDTRVIQVLRALSYCAVVVLIGIGLKSWYSQHEFHALTLFLFSTLVLLNASIHHRTQNHQIFRSVFLFLIGILFLYLTASGGESNTGPLWFYVFPPFVFYLTNLRIGALLSVLALIASFIIFRFPELPFVFTQYPTDFQIRFLTSLGFSTLFSFIMEYSRQRARQDLLRMAQLYERASRTDELTQLSNRRDMQLQLEKEFERFERHGHHFSVILLDVDHFKTINDTFGHDAGDHVLVEFSRTLRDSSRKLDVVARWGGEEFLILLPNTSLLQALALAERLRKRIEQQVILYKGQDISITASCGVCSISQSKNLKNLLIQADLNLYQAKEKGRNLIIPMVVQKRDEASS